MIKIKSGEGAASIAGLRPEIVLGIAVASGVFNSFGYRLIITEGTGGMHGVGSLHYVGLAVDIRRRHIPDANIPDIILKLKECLGDEFDVVPHNTHIHIEYQPK